MAAFWKMVLDGLIKYATNNPAVIDDLIAELVKMALDALKTANTKTPPVA